MTGNLKLLINFVEKFLGTVKFRNDQIAPIHGYGDLVQGAVTIKRLYYVEGLNHNLFSVGQFCDANLEVAFRKPTCFIRDLKGNDLLTGSRETDLYSITLQDINSPNPICLMAKATSSQAWLWHRRLSHLNFDTINLLSKNDIVVGLPKLKFIKDRLCSSCELGKAKRKSFHTKLTPSSKRRLQLLHMDLCGPMRVASLSKEDFKLKLECRANQDNSPRINRNAGYENQRIGNVAGARETVGSTVVQKSGIQCYNCKEFGHVARECQKPKRAKDAAYHREKMLMCKQEEAGIQLNVSPDAVDSGPIFDDEPLQKVSNDDHYNVFAMESTHPEQSKSVHDTYHIEQDAQNVNIDSLDMSYDKEKIDQNDDDNDLAKERELLASLIEKLKSEIDERKNRNKFLETSNKNLIEKLKGEIEDFKT
nr:retrovirus-related Pol polyprotein from transposon TNT 1-94 [Tanacetum cinerariifolium]